MFVRDRPDHCTIVVAYIPMIDGDPRTQDQGHDRTLLDSALRDCALVAKAIGIPRGCSTRCFEWVQRRLGSSWQLLPSAPHPCICHCKLSKPRSMNSRAPPFDSLVAGQFGSPPLSDETIGIPKPWFRPAPQCLPGPSAAINPPPAADRRQICRSLSGFKPVSNRKRADFLTNGFGYRFSRGHYGRSFGRFRPSTSERVSA